MVMLMMKYVRSLLVIVENIRALLTPNLYFQELMVMFGKCTRLLCYPQCHVHQTPTL